MIIEKKPTYLKNLFSILKYIASDKPSASLRFQMAKPLLLIQQIQKTQGYS